MDFPKNITQIGEADATCKIYVEDYVVSFLKQLNPLAKDKTMAAALYGKRKTEEDKTFLFVYGAGKLDFLQRETKHLSQAQKQEIDRIKNQYFGEYEFLGYRILDGEAVDGFHVFDRDACRYVSGYAQFYEKNEAMLSYMLESRQTEVAPECIDSEKYDAARSRQEKRREKYVHHVEKAEGEEAENKPKQGGLKVAAAAALVILGALGLAMNSSVLEGKGISWDKLKAEFTEKKLPDLTEVDGQEILRAAESLHVAAEPMDKQEESVSRELVTSDPVETVATSGKAEVGTEVKKSETTETVEEKKQEPEMAEAEGKKEETVANAGGNEKKEETIPENVEGKEKEPAVYIVKKGDTLTGISLRTYGSEKFVGEICKLNSIVNPDEIQIGQKILLP